MKALLLRATAPVVSLASCLVLFGGVASAQSITDSGRNSTNTIEFKNICVTDVDNNTHVSVSNHNDQDADSGNANVSGNDDVNNVNTGSASNTNSTSFDLSVTNTTNGCFAQQPQGGQGGGETPTPVTPAATTPTPAGGQGGGEVAAAPQVAAVPVGGVGAGAGSPAYLAGLAGVTLMSGALGARRLQRSFKNRF